MHMAMGLIAQDNATKAKFIGRGITEFLGLGPLLLVIDIIISIGRVILLSSEKTS